MLRLKYKSRGGDIVCQLWLQREGGVDGRPRMVHAGELRFTPLDWPEVRARFRQAGVTIERNTDPPNLERGGRR